MRGSNQQRQNAPQTADDLLDLIQHHLPHLWRTQHHSGSRALRTLLHAAERIIGTRQPAPPPSRPHAGKRS